MALFSWLFFPGFVFRDYSWCAWVIGSAWDQTRFSYMLLSVITYLYTIYLAPMSKGTQIHSLLFFYIPDKEKSD